MKAIGFARTLDAYIGYSLTILVVMIVVYCLIRFLLIPRLEMSEPEEEGTIKAMNIIAGSISALVILFFVIGAVSMSVSNRTPRQDVDRSGIYRQMESH